MAGPSYISAPMSTCSSCSEPLQEGARFCPACGAKIVEDVPGQDPLLGRTLNDKYRILSEIGSGSMGTVYLAEHISLQKKVALKVLRPELMAGDESITRFQREGIAAGKFTHPNAIQIFDFDRDGDELFFLAMEFIEGEDLGEFLRREKRVSVEEALALLRQILSALSEAHTQGIVHRDLKPENIMVVTAPSGERTIKVLDFGLSKLVHLPLGASLATQPGRIMGTPLYMAPEQGVGDPVDHRSDIYAVGLILYELVSGVRPFRSDSVVELISKQISAPVPALTESHPNLKIPGALEDVIQRALEKRKEDRFQSAQEMLEALEAIDPSDRTPATRRPAQPIAAAASAGAASASDRDARGPSKGMLAAIAILAAIAVGLGVRQLGLFGGNSSANYPRASMKPMEERSSFETSYVLQLDEARRRLSEGNTREALRRLRDAAALPCVDSEANFVRAMIWLASDDTNAAQQELRAALDADPNYAEAASELAWIEIELGNVDEAETLFAEIEEMPAGEALAAAGQGELRLRRDDAEGAVTLLERAIEIDSTLPRAPEILGRARLALGQHKEAIEAFGDARRNAPASWRAAAGLADAYLATGRSLEAEREYLAAIDLAPDEPAPLTALATLMLEDGRTRDAVELLDEKLRPNRTWGAAHVLLAAAQAEQGDIGSALEALEHAFRAGVDDARAHTLAGILLHESGEAERATQAYTRAIELDAGALAARRNLGLLQFEQELFTEAAESLESVLEIEASDAFVHRALGVIYKDYIGDATAAREHLERYQELDGSDARVNEWLQELGG